MPRFYVDSGIGFDKSITITGADVNHIKNVLRLKCGDKITIGDGMGKDYLCKICEIGNDCVVADIEDVFANATELPVRITLFQGMPKSDKMEFIIQKAIELGVTEIVPVMTKRTVVKIDEKKEQKKLERFQAIAMSAAKQSGRGIVPKVKEFMTFKQALSYAKNLDMNIIPYEDARGIGYAKEVIGSVAKNKSLGIFIGPEGGFAKEEVDFAMSLGAKCITLGNRILRTETAGMAILSILMFELESSMAKE
ncbi:MAG: 16S rRNA (uracil(1498)-N(3))-methyltransferase [Eubacteriales bacterium]|nr:16S rRNA (uracil(1498)-N(3))-methyltransferase [Eubacteriales bacterium]